MSTRVYGASDDLIEFDGDVAGEVNHFEPDDNKPGALVMCSDATVLEVKYGKRDEAIWEIRLLKRGNLFDRIDVCTDEDADPYSDVAHFADGLKWAFAASEWEQVK